jgi:hypothetical protein
LNAGIAAAHLGGDGDFLGDLGKGCAALFILATLAVLDVGPFGMSCHADLL